MTAAASDSLDTSVEAHDWVAHWLLDFRACLSGTHGLAWRSRAEQEVRVQHGTPVGDRQRAATWRRTREEILGATVA